MMAQAELPALSYSSPLEELSERFHSSPDVMRALSPGSSFDRAGEHIKAPNITSPPPGAAAHIFVSRSESSVRAYDDAGKLLAFYVATTGSSHDPLPIGDFFIDRIVRNPPYFYNAKLFWDAEDKSARAVIKPGPNNPVGVVWMDLSIPHYGIHGTPEPGRIGHTYSHGCIRFTNWDALELASIIAQGMPATLRE
jgi:lipoprotein-anchoring transpeptidase ErfK/SrfK